MRTRSRLVCCVALLGSLGLALSLVQTNVIGTPARSRRPKVKSDLQRLGAAIDAFATAQHRWPYALDELGAAVSDDYFSAGVPLLDPWCTEYCFEWTAAGSYLITCFGADGIPGGFGEDADIVIERER